MSDIRHELTIIFNSWFSILKTEHDLCICLGTFDLGVAFSYNLCI